jgi:hypothetical protein
MSVVCATAGILPHFGCWYAMLQRLAAYQQRPPLPEHYGYQRRQRFIAYEIIKRLEKQNQLGLLQQLQQAVEITDRKRNKLHEVWEDSFVPIVIGRKECASDKFIKQKLDYMHNNPCKGKWNLAASPVD